MHTKAVTLHTGLHNAIITASRDETLPMLCAIEITSDGKQLVLVSTDRFRMGMARVQLDEGGGAWRFLLKLKDAETLLKSLKTVKRDALWRTAEIEFESVPSGTFTKDVLTVKLNSGESFTFDGVDAEFPKWRQLLPANGTETAEAMTGFTAEYLAAFGKVIADTPRIFLRHFGARKPRIVTIGDDYVGLIMPSVNADDVRAWTRPAWLAEPKVKRAKKTA
jgi:DNA polymerase III sliding clamp (beta) subunit (PCNA family)